jgi:sterol desaturase/sphingolipid hydroxylase (fatty acid hydroxylase superfamily)
MSARTLFLVGVGSLILWLERRRALRRRVEPAFLHAARNLTMAGLSAAVVHLVEMPMVMPLARRAEQRDWGVVRRLPLTGTLRAALAVILLDYTLYLWHVIVHRVSWLWRLHLVHHVDLDLDATTGIRFHFAEIAASVPWRAAQVVVIGPSPGALVAWQTLTLACVVFHHSNAALPIGLERWLARVLVTPRMHGIHHSVVRSETDSNYSSGLSIWDWLHGTLRLNVPHDRIEIGVPAYRNPSELGLATVLALPVTHDRDAWTRPDGTAPSHDPAPAPSTVLLP